MSLLSYRYKKDVLGRLFSLKCRGNLNLSTILLICWINLSLFFYVEYQMEYLMKSLSTSPSFILDGALNGSKLTLAAIRFSQ